MADENFSNWLIKRLTSLDIDSDVYKEYICGILNEDDCANNEELEQSLTDILGAFLVRYIHQAHNGIAQNGSLLHKLACCTNW